MHKIFLCHASEDKPVAERIQLALATAGHKVFYDEQSLPPGGDFHDRIEQGIRECDLFIFLISPSSIAPGRFTLTELKFARDRWPSPVGRVLPVNLQNLPANGIPAYLTAATLLGVSGNPASEVRAAAEKMLVAAANRKRRRAAIAIAGGSLAVILPVAVLRLPVGTAPVAPAPAPCRDASHGVESYARSLTVDRVSPWMGGGYSQDPWCNDVISSLRGEYPAGTFQIVSKSESSKNTCPPFNCPQYQYRCSVRVNADPVYALKVSPACK